MKTTRKRSDGFSLVEVVVAIGVVAYAIFGVLGLLPVGIKGFQNATCEAAGSDVLNSLSVALRSAQTTNGTNFDWSFNGTTCSYIVGGSKTTNGWSTLSLEGGSSINSFYRQLTAVCIVTPPSSPNGAGSAVLSVAWPAAANPAFNGTNLTWSRSQGSLTLPIRFLPRMPQP
jgi:uncharacterized protein (TIGR02598 family)